MDKELINKLRKLNAEVAYFAIDMIGKSAYDCANFINDFFRKVNASTATFYDTTSDSYENTDTFAIYLDNAWLIVETKEN